MEIATVFATDTEHASVNEYVIDLTSFVFMMTYHYHFLSLLLLFWSCLTYDLRRHPAKTMGAHHRF